MQSDLEEALGDVSFPADKWHIIFCAEFHGIDLRTRRHLYQLPVREYRSSEDVTAALEERGRRR